ncbi:hypothetical protein EDB92DRAFT_1948160 [Lactarius akahatsu]|uniref:Uncharacterized protein n=1 Tax=Lactarius akahatsu TaxID=416441 RepID=A0AAD4LDX9_9AGAM|nr:hypothetical protein EDB92DRAFT_1948160 [Lactarius akahatsu]
MSQFEQTLPIDAVARANGNARRDGTFAGLTAGLLGVTGILSGYQFTQGFAAANMSRLRAEVAAAQEAKRKELQL